MSEENSAETNYPAGSRYAPGGGGVMFEPRVAVDVVQVVEDVG